jgi:uncharacterized protein YcbK (DUF882 family)
MNGSPRVVRRRGFLRHGAGAATFAACAAFAMPTRAAGARSLALVHTHTHETLEITYAVGGQAVPSAMTTVNRFLRDHYTGAIGEIDPSVLDQLHRVRLVLGSTQPFEVISGYRAAATNAHLRASRGGGVAQRSLHMEGRAIDVRLRGTALPELRDAALQMRAGGVGYYAREGFVHLDSGRVRHW